MNVNFQQLFLVVKMTESEEWTYFNLLFMYFITVNKYRFCISVIGYINMQIIGIGYKKINICRSLYLFLIYIIVLYSVQRVTSSNVLWLCM